MLEKDDTIAVGLSGGKDSTTCLYLLNKILQKQGTPLIAIAIDEGIHGYREKTLAEAHQFCNELGIKLHITSYKDELGFTLDEYLKQKKPKTPCAPCGVFRRYLLNKAARRLKATKLATGHNLDDEAQSIIMNQFKGNISFSAKLGPVTGALSHEHFIKRIKPLYFITEKETTIYSKLKQFPVSYYVCPNSFDSFRITVGNMLNKMEQQYPGTKQGIVQSFLDILPKLKERYQGKQIGTCTSCGEPAAKSLCRACELLEKK